MRGWMVGLWLGLVVVAGAGTARACTNCTVWNACQSNRMGSLICLSSDWSCLQIGRCSGPGIISDAAVIGITLLEEAGTTAGAQSAVAPLAGQLAVGRGAVKIAGRALGAGLSDASLVYSATGYFEAGTAAFRSPQGDGFTIRREHDGRAARLTVCELAGTRPGRVLASERVGGDDALVVRVPFAGRPHVLVVTAALVSEAEAEARQAAAHREMRASAGARPQRPPFEVELVE